ncbi:DM13 domain-containing protein [Argonema galeatum]|uniref:DM13 domain-containing protein n=1 Tax=Argonema galeatum TaxID=2942762 RepID=UPI0020115FB1|nr:DM13 domain-containing protein [Argonema galeatum]MCL1466220.1 DM13 domain-containing protein [Argonema galeatum A003/A1]
MKLKYLAMLGAGVILSVGLATEVSSNQGSIALAQRSAEMSVQSGTFMNGEHPTQGIARIIVENGKRYLVLGNTFKTNNGPDLYVILHRSDAPPISGIRRQDYVSIGRLQKVSGMQRYAIPANVNLTNFRSVAIWCRRFNATFGYAALGG